MLRPNTLKQKLQAGETAYGAFVNWDAIQMVEFLGFVGFDYIAIDAQHGFFSAESAGLLARACDVSGAIPIARIPNFKRSTIIQYLDAGLMGLICPHVATAEEAEAIVKATRFGGRGYRSAAQSTRRANYGVTAPFSEFVEWNNQNIFVDVMIEDEIGLSNLDEILEVEGVDSVSFGPADLAFALGCDGDASHPKAQEVMQEAAARIRAKKPGQMEFAHASALLRSAAEEWLANAKK
jgi:4-hydroxy-2-oxoheptanedioate aldolase